MFGEIRQPAGRYILIPRHSSERRSIIPMGFMPSEVLSEHDVAVDAAYAVSGGKRNWKSDAERVALLFTRYQTLTSLQNSAN